MPPSAPPQLEAALPARCSRSSGRATWIGITGWDRAATDRAGWRAAGGQAQLLGEVGSRRPALPIHR